MARVNIEESLFTDPRFKALARKLGNDRLAAGTMLEAFFIAQKYWADNGSLTPEKIWALADLEILIEVDLAERRPEGIYLRGAEQHFDWLLKKRMAGAQGGKKSASVRLAKFGTNQPPSQKRDTEAISLHPRSILEASSKQCFENPEAETNPLAPAPALALAPAPAQEEKKLPHGTAAPGGTAVQPKTKSPPKIKEPGKGAQVWLAYSQAYEARYGTAPVRAARENSLCCQIVDRIGVQDAPAVAAFYVSHNDRWYVQKLHPLGTLLSDIQKLRTEWLAGEQMTDSKARDIQVSSHNDKVVSDFMKRRGLT